MSSRVTLRYARALLAIGIDKGRFEQFGAQLEQFTTFWREHRHLRPTLENPSHPLSRRRAVLQRIGERLGLDPLVGHFLLLLLDRHRLHLIQAITRDYQLLADRHAGRIRAYVTSARPLDTKSLEQLRNALEKRTGQAVLIAADTEPSLLAGTLTRIGSTVYDGTLHTRLEQLGQAIMVGKL